MGCKKILNINDCDQALCNRCWDKAFAPSQIKTLFAFPTKEDNICDFKMIKNNIFVIPLLSNIKYLNYCSILHGFQCIFICNR